MSEPHCIEHSMVVDIEQHWNDTYLKIPSTNLGWYEEHASPSLKLIEQCDLAKDANIVNAGAGTSNIVESLLKLGFTNIVVNDIAAAPLAEMRDRLSDWKNASLEFVVDDLTKSRHLTKLRDVALWYDRAVMHFFTDAVSQNAYFDLIRQLVKIDGYVILAEFSLNGAQKCSGLPVVNYNKEMLCEKMGNDFELLNSFDYSFTQPSGDTRAYIYTLFKRRTKK